MPAALLAVGAIGAVIGTHTHYHLLLLPALVCELTALALILRRRHHR